MQNPKKASIISLCNYIKLVKKFYDVFGVADDGRVGINNKRRMIL